MSGFLWIPVMVAGGVQECQPPAPNLVSYHLHPTSAPGGRVHDVFDDDQAAIQELEAEEDKTTTRHIRFKT